MIDDKDKKIIEELVKDSRQTTSQLSRKLNIPITTIHNHIKKLIEMGVIINYTVNLNHVLLGRTIPAYVWVSINYNVPGKKISQSEISAQLKKIDGVYEVYILTGGSDVLVKVLVKDISELNNLVTEKLRNIPGIDKTQTSIILKEV